MSLPCSPRVQSGFSSVVAIFLITVLAGLAAVGMQMWSNARDDQTLDLQSVRVRLAARAGLQAGFLFVGQGTCPSALPVTLVLTGTLEPYQVAITCTLDGPYTDAPGADVYRHTLVAVACNQASCPDNAASASALITYAEAVVRGECIVKGSAKPDCRETR